MDDMIKFWDWKLKNLLNIDSGMFSPQALVSLKGKYLVAGSRDGEIKIWKLNFKEYGN